MAAPPIRRPHPPPPPPPRPPHPSPLSSQNTPLQNGGDNASLTAAADLIRTLDSAFAEMSSLSVCAAKDAEDARRNARAASEMARRYTARSFLSSLNFPLRRRRQRCYQTWDAQWHVLAKSVNGRINYCLPRPKTRSISCGRCTCCFLRTRKNQARSGERAERAWPDKDGLHGASDKE
jgi:hypothetical protein